jgi:hypothetical protein
VGLALQPKSPTKFDLATICPPYVHGPIIHQVPKAESLNTSVALFRDVLVGKKSVEDCQPQYAPPRSLCLVAKKTDSKDYVSLDRVQWWTYETLRSLT